MVSKVPFVEASQIEVKNPVSGAKSLDSLALLLSSKVALGKWPTPVS